MEEEDEDEDEDEEEDEDEDEDEEEGERVQRRKRIGKIMQSLQSLRADQTSARKEGSSFSTAGGEDTRVMDLLTFAQLRVFSSSAKRYRRISSLLQKGRDRIM